MQPVIDAFLRSLPSQNYNFTSHKPGTVYTSENVDKADLVLVGVDNVNDSEEPCYVTGRGAFTEAFTSIRKGIPTFIFNHQEGGEGVPTWGIEQLFQTNFNAYADTTNWAEWGTIDTRTMPSDHIYDVQNSSRILDGLKASLDLHNDCYLPKWLSQCESENTSPSLQKQASLNNDSIQSEKDLIKGVVYVNTEIGDDEIVTRIFKSGVRGYIILKASQHVWLSGSSYMYYTSEHYTKGDPEDIAWYEACKKRDNYVSKDATDPTSFTFKEVEPNVVRGTLILTNDDDYLLI